MENELKMNFTFNFNAPVGQNIAHVEHLEAHFDKDMSMQVLQTEESTPSTIDGKGLPMSLSSEPAMKMWSAAKKNRWVNDQFMPIISQRKAAILASVMSDELGLDPRWPEFERLWKIDDLSTKLSQAQGTKYYYDFLKEIEMSLTNR